MPKMLEVIIVECRMKCFISFSSLLQFCFVYVDAFGIGVVCKLN